MVRPARSTARGFYREEEKWGWEVWNLNAGVNGESIGARAAWC